MNIDNLYEGQEIKNYKCLCELLEIKCSSGSTRIMQLKKFGELVDYHKIGNKYIIDKINNNDNNATNEEEIIIEGREMNLKNLYDGQFIPNYKELCKVLEVKQKTNQKEKEKQLADLSLYVDFTSHINKDGNKGIGFVINKIISTEYVLPEKKYKYDDILTPKEINNEFDGYYVYAHLKNNVIMYIGKGCKRRCVLNHSRNYNVQNDMDEIKILKRFDNEYDALVYEEDQIEYYKSIGQCEYNDDSYHFGKLRDYDKVFILNKIDKLKEKYNNINDKIDKLQNDKLNIEKEIKELESKL